MARANRHLISGDVWHITHRCHKKESLLKFAHVRTRFVMWLREARKRFCDQIVNYAVTSNYDRLLLKDRFRWPVTGGILVKEHRRWDLGFRQKKQQMLGMLAKGRAVVSAGDLFMLRESPESYGVNFTPKNRPIVLNNAHYWDVCL